MDIDDVQHYPEEFVSTACFTEGEHTGITTGTVSLGTHRERIVTKLCIHCNVRLETWREYPDDYRFTE